MIATTEPIAVIGMSFKFPGGAETSEDLWQMLAGKRNVANEVPKDRFNIDAFWNPDSSKQNIINAKQGHFLTSDPRDFDAGFFSMAPHEVIAMDPQHRGLMETTYHAFENSGLRLDDVAGSKTSVHVGCFTNDFASMQSRDTQNIPKYNSLGTAGSMLANRISWFYDLRGESMSIDTACSSSMVAMALGCNGLSSGEADIAVVGGSNLMLVPEFGISLSNMSMLSPSGRCQSFDAKADGYGRGEGFAILILKSLSKAIRDGNPIRALVRSIGMNQDGYTSSGITQPSKDMQLRLIRDTYKKAGIDMKHTRFFEAHGTGTPVGDPIEARAIGEAFFHSRTKDDPIYVGAVKSNVGHLEGASGLAGVVKTILALERAVIPPNANFEDLNPQIDADFFNLRFPTECIPWPHRDDPIRRASVNSFGFGGSNSHVILEASGGFLEQLDHRIRSRALWYSPKQNGLQVHGAMPEHAKASAANGLFAAGAPVGDICIPTTESLVDKGTGSRLALNGSIMNASDPATGSHWGGAVNNGAVRTTVAKTQDYTNEHSDRLSNPRLLVLSASDEDGVLRQARNLEHFPVSAHHQQDHDTVLQDIAFTLTTRRTMLEWKSYKVLTSLHDISELGTSLPAPFRKPHEGTARLGLIFTGQGAQWPRMSWELLSWPVFRASLDDSQVVLNTLGCKWSILDELAADDSASRLQDAELSQATSTAIQLALVDLLRFLKIRPRVVLGHSSGEIAAAYCAGLLCKESALRVSYFRGTLAAKVARESISSPWGMASVGVAAGEVSSAVQELMALHPTLPGTEELTISCMNSPTNTTVSGPLTSLNALVDHLKYKQIFARKLKVDVGYHSAQMSRVAHDYLDHLSSLKPGTASSGTIMVSSVSPGLVDAGEICSGRYWVQNMISPVRFDEALGVCCGSVPDQEVSKMIDRCHSKRIFVDGFLEIGPHAALQGPLRDIFKFHKRPDILYASLLLRHKPADVTLLEALGKLFSRNFELDLGRLNQADRAHPREPSIIVDLPQYPFNHSVLHWEDSSTSRAIRLRKHAHHPLLGSQLLEWNSSDAKWSLTIKKDVSPWVSDHRLHGIIWYPASGMIVMAIEAVKQLLPDDEFDFEIHNVSFTAPIIVHESSNGTDIQISMVPTSKARASHETDYMFKIFCRRHDDNWTEVCDGTISPQRTPEPPLVSHLDEREHVRQQLQARYCQVVDSCQEVIEASDMYRKIRENSGLQYGPSFQALTNVRYNRQGEAHAELLQPDESVSNTSRPYTIHPTTLDCIFQLAIPALTEGLKKTMPTLVPSRLTRLWVSRYGTAPSTSTHCSNVVHVDTKWVSQRIAESSTTVLARSNGSEKMTLQVKVEELETTEVARDEGAGDSEQEVKSLAHELVWKADMTLLDRRQVYEYCSQRRGTDPEPASWYQNVRLMLLGFAQKAFGELRELGLQPVPYMNQYATWLRMRLDEYLSQPSHGELPRGSELQVLAEHFESSGFRGVFGVLVGRHLREILTGTMDPLQTIFSDQHGVTNIYEELNRTGKAFPMLHAYLDLLVHKDPGLRFLEIGAGTGATTSTILDTIANPDQGPRYSAYTFTDISAYFFQAAQERFQAFDRVKYRILDIDRPEFCEQDVVLEGVGSYDVIVAANVLHATKDLCKTLNNVRKLLKTGGKLILVEMTTPKNVETGFIWGALPGWWLGNEASRQHSAVVDECHWELLLRKTGFNGTEHIFRDWDSTVCHGWSIMISSAVPAAGATGGLTQLPDATSEPCKVMIIVDETPSETQKRVAGLVIDALRLHDASVSLQMMTMDQLVHVQQEHLAHHLCILLVDLDADHLQDVGEQSFLSYQTLLTAAKSVLWVQSRHRHQDSPPYFAMVEGLCRVVRSERPLAKIITLTLETDSGSSAAEVMTSNIFTVFKASILQENKSSMAIEEEYMENSGYLCVNRLRQAKYLDRHVSARLRNEVVMRKFGSETPLKLGIRVPGLLDTLEWSEDTMAYHSILPDEVEIQVRAIGVNFKDCLTLLGRVNSDVIGCECAGLVRRVGEDVRGFKKGDRVAIAMVGAYCSIMRVPQKCVVLVPDSMTLEEAGGVPVAFMTAYYSLYHAGRLEKSETILIHAAAGGTGQAAVQIARHIGAEVFATVGSPAKKALLIERYGIPEDHIFYSRDASFADGIRRMTNGKGVDVVLNSLSGKLLTASWDLIADFGRFVEIGRKDIDTRGNLPMFPFKRNAMFAGVDLSAFVDNEKTNHLCILGRVFDMMKSGILRPSYPVHTICVDQAAQAFRSLVSGKTTGKLILAVDEKVMVPFRTSDDSEYRFSENATYVVAGGFGGIGRQITRWLIRRGATNVLLLTRSGADSDPVRSRLVREVKEKGVRLQCVACDITKLGSVQQAVALVSKTMPPIRGCFQAAMVIRDRPFSAMSHDEWQASVSPKVQGSWNLHAALPSGMDFFIMLSSAICIFGNAGQANYAAGNTFQDALARQRVAGGEKAVAIDLGMVLDEGWVAERKQMQQRVMQFDQVLPISQRDLFAMLDYYCNPAANLDSPVASQVVTGLELPALIVKAGRQIPAVMQRPLFSAMHQVLPGGEMLATSATQTRNIAAVFEEAETAEQAAITVAEALKEKLCKILGIDADARTIHERMDSFGVDSLIALEVRNWMAKEMHADLAVYEILGDVKLSETGMAVVRKSDFGKTRWP